MTQYITVYWSGRTRDWLPGWKCDPTKVAFVWDTTHNIIFQYVKGGPWPVIA